MSHFNLYSKDDYRYNPTLNEELESIRATSLDDVKQFHKRFYGANNAELAVVGDFDEKQVLRAIREALVGWKSPVPYVRIPNLHKQVAAVDRIIQTPDKENAVFRARLNLEMNEDDADYPALYVVNHLLGGGSDSRLYKRIREREGLSYGVGSGLNVGSIDRAGSWAVSAIAAPQNIGKVEAAFRDELTRALSSGFTDQELADAKSGILQQRVQNRSQDRSLAGGWTSNLFLGRTYAWSKQFEQRLSALTVSDLNTALQKYLDPKQITVVKAGDFARSGGAAAAQTEGAN